MNEQENRNLCYGVKSIADHLGITEPQARHLCENGTLPSFKIGFKVCARRSALDSWLVDREAAARAAPPTKPEGSANG